MSINNDKVVHSIADEDEEEDHLLNHIALSLVHYYSSRNQSKSAQVDRIGNLSNLRKHSFNVFLPRKLSEHTESELRLMLISLKNVQIASVVHIVRIERELKERGCSLSILGQ